MKKKFLTAMVLLVCLLFALFTGINLTTFPAANTEVLKVGVTAGPHAEIMETVKNVAEKNGLKIVIVEFNDYIQPNAALHQGKIDLNSFQHELYLSSMVNDRKYEITPIAKTMLFPMGIYSKKVNRLEDITAKSTILIPNDPANGGRSLQLLAMAGLVTLKPLSGYNATTADIINNPKELVIKEGDAGHLSRLLDEVDLAVINSNYAIIAGLIPTKDALLLEAVDSPYTNVVAVRTRDKDRPEVQKFILAYHSDEVKQFITDHFKGSILTTW
ncbi:MAG: MetQ/NlpA family ABC transporter substrate-binding protein [Negativicutes bacterium]